VMIQLAKKPDTKVNVDQEDVALLQSLAAIHFTFGRIERAINLLYLALWILPRDPETMRLMAIFCYRDGRFKYAASFVRAYELTGAPLPHDMTIIKQRCI
jgi:Flp pilus assembly protein TadD